ncbi:Uncharacterised protein [Mycobacteroides abscessus subsp. abscessus]|nr:Uncharacterised protein [Mycobacteroides abscessus subsp. abscessus]
MKHQRRATALTYLAVELGGDRSVGRVERGLDPGSEGAEGVVALGARPLAVDLLLIAGGHIVGDRVTEDRRSGVGSLHVLARTSDHDGEFALEVDTFRRRRTHDGHLGSNDGGVGFEEDHRTLRRFRAHFGGVCRVVLPDADHLGREDRRQQSDVDQRPRSARERRCTKGMFGDFLGDRGAIRLFDRDESHTIRTRNSAKTHTKNTSARIASTLWDVKLSRRRISLRM